MFGVGCPAGAHVKVSGFPFSTNVSHDVVLFIVGGANICIKKIAIKKVKKLINKGIVLSLYGLLSSAPSVRNNASVSSAKLPAQNKVTIFRGTSPHRT